MVTTMRRFELTQEQDELQRAVRGFAQRRLPVTHLRALRDARDPTHVSRAIWREMAALGWAGIAVDEAHGGAGLGLVELGLVMEELGRTLAPTPLLATSVIGAAALAAGEEAARAHLPALARGERLVALAFEEERRFAPYACRTTARRDHGGYIVDGEKCFVLDGPAADLFVVVARVGGAPTERAGLVVLLVDRATAGVTVEPLAMVDSRGAARVRFASVAVPAADVLGDPHDGAALLDRLLARATAALAAEMLGASDAVFHATVEYLKQRHQFGVPIGSFQALKHRAAHMFCELELTRSVVRAALVAVERGAADADALVSASKARASDTFTLVAAEAIQMHGGIGVTDELDVGFYYKRAKVADLTFGSSAYHRNRFATLHGY
jgi:alkylation response protein AidB-like acyl-CoA dehydrogenase